LRTKSQFLNQAYTAAASETGWLLGWSYKAVREIGKARPPEMKIRPNGWLLLDDLPSHLLRSAGIVSNPSDLTSGRTSTSLRAPRNADPLKRIAVERRAMKVARHFLMSRYGWSSSEIHDTSIGNPYDFEVGHGRRKVRIEVKGLSGDFGAVTLTRREVEHARTADCPVILVVVSNIAVVVDASGTCRGSGGSPKVWNPWDIDDGTMTASQFDYLPPAAV
jgi:hypothetical protein